MFSILSLDLFVNNKILNFINWFLNSYNIGVIFKYIKNIFLYLTDSTLWLTNTLIDITLVDLSTLQISNKLQNYLLVYNLLSITYNYRLQLNSFIINIIQSVADKFYSAIWLERELWDMFGIFSKFNPDLRRLLTDYGFEGFPLNKIFPLSGFNELFYSDIIKKTSYKQLELGQELRKFDMSTFFKNSRA